MEKLLTRRRSGCCTVRSPFPHILVPLRLSNPLPGQDNLHSGPLSPVSLAASDITALLPGDEEDFARGREPKSRAALEDTPPAIENPALISDPGRSLFASLIQTHHYWGHIARRAVTLTTSAGNLHASSSAATANASNSKTKGKGGNTSGSVNPGAASAAARASRPWEHNSEYFRIKMKLAEWEQKLPHEHLWSSFLLKGYKTEGQDLAYLGVTMVTRLCNIVLRRAYLKQ